MHFHIIAENITYTFPSGRPLFRDLNFSLSAGEKAALIGDNGTGKSTLLRIFSGCLQADPGSGVVQASNQDHWWIIPQHVGQFDSYSIAQVLKLQGKVTALQKIEQGSADPKHFDTLAEDWSVRERIQSVLYAWGLSKADSDTSFGELSGGEKTRLLLAGIDIHKPDLVLMDEPTNHLDRPARKRLYRMVSKSKSDFLIISHDRELLNLCGHFYELTSHGISTYGGSFSFYQEQKQAQTEALEQQIHHAQQSISKAQKKYRETMQRKQKRDTRGGKKAKGENLPKIMMNSMRNRAENSSSQLNEIHNQKISGEKEQLQRLKNQRNEIKNIRITLASTDLHDGTILYEAERINYAWPGSEPVWAEPFSFTICSGERILITGNNGSGKSTLMHLLNGRFIPSSGTLKIRSRHRFLIDQEYKLINREITVLEQANRYNTAQKYDHEVKTLLYRHLFEEDKWSQMCRSLSGGEMKRLCLCCLALQADQPDTLLLDEPANNLDLHSIQLLTRAISEYKGTLIVVSHDRMFTEEVKLKRKLQLTNRIIK